MLNRGDPACARELAGAKTLLLWELVDADDDEEPPKLLL